MGGPSTPAPWPPDTTHHCPHRCICAEHGVVVTCVLPGPSAGRSAPSWERFPHAPPPWLAPSAPPLPASLQLAAATQHVLHVLVMSDVSVPRGNVGSPCGQSFVSSLQHHAWRTAGPSAHPGNEGGGEGSGRAGRGYPGSSAGTLPSHPSELHFFLRSAVPSELPNPKRPFILANLVSCDFSTLRIVQTRVVKKISYLNV